MHHRQMNLSDCKYCLKVALVMFSLLLTVFGEPWWKKPGCFRTSHKREVKIPGCVNFWVETNACIGYCKSFAFPSPKNTLTANPDHLITSMSSCCTMVETHDVPVKRVQCMRPDGQLEYRDFTFKSALKCTCTVCKKGG